jgi:polygalacturonase
MILSPMMFGKSVRDCGASGNGETNDTVAIQATIDAVAAAGGGSVLIPPGSYHCGSLFLKSAVSLYLAPGSRILGSRDPRDYPLIESRWEGSTRPVHAALIHAQSAANLGISGTGTIDGRGERFWELFRSRALDHPRPRLMAFEDCVDLSLSGFTALNSPSWTVNPVRCKGVTIAGIRIVNPSDSPNTDGINPDSCQGVVITGCRVSVGDDCITIKSGTEDEKAALMSPSRDIAISDCILESGHGAIVIGSEMSGGVRDVVVSNCVFKGTDRGVRIKTRRGRGGRIEGLRVSNVVMRGVMCPFAINMRYACGRWGDPLVSSLEKLEPDSGTPYVGSISFNAISVFGATGAAAWLDGLPESPIRGLSFSDVDIAMDPEGREERPEMADGVPLMRSSGLFARNVSGLWMSGLRIREQRGPACVFESVEGLEMNGCFPAEFPLSAKG